MERSPRWAALVIRVVFVSFAVMLTIGILLLVRHDARAIANDPGFQGLSQDIRQNVHVSTQVVSMLLVLGMALAVALVVIPAQFASEHGREWPERWLPRGTYVVASILDHGDRSRGIDYATVAIRHVERVKGSPSAATFWYQVVELPLADIFNQDIDGDTLRVKPGKNGSCTYHFFYDKS